MPWKATLLGDRFHWFIEFNAAWQVIGIEILFYMLKRKNECLFKKIQLSRALPGMMAANLCKLPFVDPGTSLEVGEMKMVHLHQLL
jgi:hypothetical protein